ncbi:HD domain-containing protein [Candidatus Peregrinibacteria bacterium]|nr:HD domain-containing protein [Candidatus Peregrinibacteria bacterium]
MTKKYSIKDIVENLKEGDAENIKKAADFSFKYLSNIPRRSGESYFQHGMEVAGTLKEVSNDPKLLRVGLIHDLYVHPQGKKLVNELGLSADDKSLIQGMYGLRRLHIDKKTDDLDHVVNTIIRDPRLVIMRMAHRMNDVRNLERFSERMARNLAGETLHMYSAIVGKLNMNIWRREMEDTCFKWLYPESANSIQYQMDRVKKMDEACLIYASEFLHRKLGEHGLKVKISSRIKGVYSAYRKMLIKNLNFGELYDRLAIRILVDKEEDCYKALWVVHKYMNPVFGLMHDYIGMPKENGYQSLHTVVHPLSGVTDRSMEVQIRTHEMHSTCEFGVAAHGNYKKVNYSLTRPGARVNLLRNLSVMKQGIESVDKLDVVMQQQYIGDHMLVFDNNNNIHYVPKPSTALDFVCTIHGAKVNRLKEVRVNGRKQSMGTLLNDGDTLEVSFSRQKVLKRNWKDYCEGRFGRELVRQLSSGVGGASH